MEPGETMDDISERVSDPAGDGLPEIADDDSYADDGHESARDEADTPPLPPDREDGPLALDAYGTTAYERVHGESLARRLARELPEVGARRAYEDPDPGLAEDVDPDAVGQLQDDTRALSEDDPIEPIPGSVSVFDRHISGVPSVRPVGRIVRPGGGNVDVEAEEFAYDVGLSAGGFGSEELAMHEIPAEQLDLEDEESTHEPYIAEPAIRTGADQPWDPEDLAVAEGRDPTPANVERARRELEELGPAAIEKTVP